MVDRKSTTSRYLQRGSIAFEERFSLRICIKALVLLLVAQNFWTVAAPACAATLTASVNASVNKPLVLTKVQDLDMGTVTLGTGVWSNATVSISQAGVMSCGSANVVCSGATMAATYNVQGSKQQVVHISVPNVTLVNQSNSSQTLALTTNAPATLTLANSGFPGSNFSIGGSVTLNSNTPSGVYVGTMNVTVDY